MGDRFTATELTSTTSEGVFHELLRDAAHVSEPAPTHGAITLCPGSVLAGGRLSVIRRIGAGGMGIVYEAFDLERNQRVALKTLSELKPTGVYRLKNEFRSLTGVVHPNLVALHELFADCDTWFFTMDLVDGVRFDKWLRPANDVSVALDPSRLSSALAQLLAATDAIHAAGKLHRDLKPGNVLVTPEGRVVVLDFGLAIDFERGSSDATVTDDWLHGTPGYMAPEQSAGQPATQASDLYSIGVMLFEVIAGRLPFEGRAHELLVEKQRCVAPDVRRFVPVSEELASLCSELLAREPKERPTCRVIRERLGLRAQPVSVQPRASITASPLLGREAELAQLRAAYDAMSGADGPVIVLLEGESGIGKSALVETFLAEVRASRRAVVLSGRCFEQESVPFKGFDAIMDELSRYLRRIDLDQVNALLPRDAYALRRLFPVLGRIEAIAAAPERDVADAHELRRRAFLALGELFARIGDRQPLVLHIDDLQWSDADSTRLWMHLVRQPDAPRLLLIASHRSEDRTTHPCLQPLYTDLVRDTRLDVRQTKLGPLSANATRALMERQLRVVSEQIIDDAAGNPFFAIELALRAARAQAHATAEGASLQALIQSRVQALPDTERALLEVLSVASRPIALPLAADAAGGATRATFEALRSMRLARSTGDGARIECFHDKIRAVMMGMLGANELRDRHGALARALRESADSDPEHIAGHLLGAGDSVAASVFWLEAAQRADATLSFERAARFYRLALDHGRFTFAVEQRLRVARANALAEAGDAIVAAQAFLAAVPGASASDAISYQQQAAEQLVYCGQHPLGEELFATVFKALGLHMPWSTAGTVAAIAYGQLRLRLQRDRWCGASAVDARTRCQLDALHAASNALIRVDFAKGVALCMQGALLALQRGTAQDAAEALARLIYVNAAMGGSEARCEELTVRAEGLMGGGATRARFGLATCRGVARAIALGPRDVSKTVADLQLAIDLSRDHVVRGLSYHRSLLEFLLALTRSTAGQLAEVANELPARFDDAWNRNDLTILPYWMAVYGYCGIATEDLAGLEHAYRKVRAAWTHSAATLQELDLDVAHSLLTAYRGDWRGSFLSIERAYRGVRRSAVRRSVFAENAQVSYALGAAAWAKQLAKGRERDALVAVVEVIARKGKHPLVCAALACVRADCKSALQALKAYVPNHWAIENQAVKRRLGALLGGTEGARLCAEADAFFRAGGVVDPERFTIALTPGLAIDGD